MIEQWQSVDVNQESINSTKNSITGGLLAECLNFEPAQEANIELHGNISERFELALLEALKNESELEHKFVEDSFLFYKSLPLPEKKLEQKIFILKMACLGILSERSQEVSSLLSGYQWAESSPSDWWERLLDTALSTTFYLLRRQNWEDIDKVELYIKDLRRAQSDYEKIYIESQSSQKTVIWKLISLYHYTKGIDLLNTFISKGYSNENLDIRVQTESHFDKSLNSLAKVFEPSLETLIQLFSKISSKIIDNSLWSLSRSTSPKIREFISSLMSRERNQPIFELLPPQRMALKEEGLLGASYRSVVVNLPTSSGKTLISEFRILQTLSQSHLQNSWVAYLVPTRVLVNQITQRLRIDFAPVGISVEKASPALTIDSIEESILTESDDNQQFRVLVTTPEKFDLLIRNGWESKIGRPLNLVVVDEAHNIGASERGIKLELMLATVNRECRDAQFLLLTPFITNATQVARWLSPDSYNDVAISLDWKPKDRAIGITQITKGKSRGEFSLKFETLHTSKSTLEYSDQVELFNGRRLGLSWSKAKSSLGNIAAVVTDYLTKSNEREGIIVLASTVRSCWTVARMLAEHRENIEDEDINLVKSYFTDEFGDEYELSEFISKGIGIHNSSLSDEAKLLTEWLFDTGKIKILVATTTIAQGVNFPVSTVIMSSNKYPFGKVMPPDDFWNLAGRVGRVGQREIGLVCMVSENDQRSQELKDFVKTSVEALNSQLIKMVSDVLELGDSLDLHSLFYKPEWSSFLQYLAHTYRQVGSQRDFTTEIEHILRGTFGYRELRTRFPKFARQLISSVENYAVRLASAKLGLVDSTGFSPEAINIALSQLSDRNINYSIWDDDQLFSNNSENLKDLMGVMLSIPELRENLKEVLGGSSPDSFLLSNIISDWVNGSSIREIAERNFSDRISSDEDKSGAIGDCCKIIYRNIVNTATWGISALQSMTYSEGIASNLNQPEEEIRNIPSKIYYGVNDVTSISLRMNFVPRSIIPAIKNQFDTDLDTTSTRQKLSANNGQVWKRALGRNRGENYFKLWKIFNGEFS